MSDQNNTTPPHDVELKFQLQTMTKLMERMNFVMGNVCDRLEKWENMETWLGQDPRHEKGWG